MSNATLEHVQQLVDQLSPLDQVRLLEFLAPRIVRVVHAHGASTINSSEEVDAWAEFFHVGDLMAAGDSGVGETLTEAVLDMRR